MAMVFVNFRTKQSGQAAGRIARRLAERLGDGVVFKDSESIAKGEDFEAALARALAEADAMVVVVGSQWVCPELNDEDDWVRREVAHALERKIPIVPAFVDGADVGVVKPGRLPPGLKDLATKNGQVIRHGEQEFRDDIELIARDLAARLGIPLPPAETTTASRPGSRAVVPARGLCLGRDAQVATLVARLTAAAPSPVLVLGDAGMGKSTVTIAALHADAVRQRFGQRRYFVRLDGATSADAVVGSIAQVLGLSGGRLREQVFASLAQAPAVLVLDNFESAWEPDRPAAEALLGELAAIERLSLCVTLRGHERPAGLWLDAPLKICALPPDVAAALFCQVANWDVARARDPALHGLLNPLGGVPLAIVLLAHAVEGTSDIALLASEWQHRRTALLARPGAQPDRLSSWAVSLELSWDSPRLGDAGRCVVAVLAQLPDGIAVVDVEATLGAGLLEGKRRACKVGLAHEEDGRLRQLAPVREHVAAHHAASGDDWRRVTEFYMALALALGDRPGSRGGQEAIDRLAPERANLHAVLEAELAAADPRPAIRAAAELRAFHVFSGHATPSALPSASDRAGAIGDVLLEARCIKCLADIERAHSHYTSARLRFEEALTRYERVGDVRGQAGCILRLGDIHLARAEYSGARRRYEAALSLNRRIGDLEGQANCIKGLGDVDRDLSDRESARRRYLAALSLFEQADAVLGQARCIKGLGDLDLAGQDLTGARERYEAALQLNEQLGSVRGQGNCVSRLGDVDREGSDHVSARQRYEAALPLYAQVGDVRGQAHCIQGFGDIDHARLDDEAARARYDEALDLYRRIPDPHAIGQCLRRLARLAPATAASRLLIEEARAAWTSIDRPDLVVALDREFGPADSG